MYIKFFDFEKNNYITDTINQIIFIDAKGVKYLFALNFFSLSTLVENIRDVSKWINGKILDKIRKAPKLLPQIIICEKQSLIEEIIKGNF